MDNTNHIKTLEWTGERYIPEIKGDIALEHLHRYAMACQFAKGKNVLDIASGEGYGSAMLAKVANHVIGVDISEEAISFATGKYSSDNLEFKIGSCAEIPLMDGSLDLIVSFETIEHHDQHEVMFKEFKRVLHPDGMLIISSPDKYTYSEMPDHSNPFHVKELYRNEFESLVSKYFENTQIYGQRVIYGSGIFVEKGATNYVNFSEDGEDIDINYGLFRPTYNIIIASNADLTEAVSGIFELPVGESDIVQSLTQERDKAFEQHNIAMAERNEMINGLNAQLNENEAEFSALKNELNVVYSSKSWRMTEPLRMAREITSNGIIRFVSQPKLSLFLTSGSCHNIFRRLYRVMPLSPLRKQRMKDFFLRKFLFFLQTRGRHPGQILFNSTECDMLDLSHTLKLPVGPPQILVVDERLPTPDQDSGSERMSKILKLLTDIGYTITFVSGRNEKLKSYEMNLKRLGIRIIYGFHGAIKHLQELGHTYRHVFLSRPETAFEYLAPVRAFAINATVLYDTVDLAWVRLTREAEVLGDKAILNQAEHFKRMELSNISCSDVIISITPEEKEMILRENPDCRVEVIPNIHQCVAMPNPFLLRKNLMFIGGFWHTPNQDAVFYFVNSILPLVLRDIPEIIFYIVGSNMPSSIRALESQNIKPVGYVPDVSPYFESSRVFVSPLRFGAGMKGKIGQSMSYGLPVVTNSIGAEGMRLTHEVNVLVADNSEAFAEEVVRLYSQEDLWTRLSNNSITYIQENLSEASVKERLLQIFGDEVDKPSG